MCWKIHEEESLCACVYVYDLFGEDGERKRDQVSKKESESAQEQENRQSDTMKEQEQMEIIEWNSKKENLQVGRFAFRHHEIETRMMCPDDRCNAVGDITEQ